MFVSCSRWCAQLAHSQCHDIEEWGSPLQVTFILTEWGLLLPLAETPGIRDLRFVVSYPSRHGHYSISGKVFFAGSSVRLATTLPRRYTCTNVCAMYPAKYPVELDVWCVGDADTWTLGLISTQLTNESSVG